MKRCLMLALAGGLMAGTTANAQTAQRDPLVRTDVTMTLGWLNGRKPSVEPYQDDWYNRGLTGGGSLGWYWSDHHKTEIEAATSNTVHLDRFQSLPVGGIVTYRTSELGIRTNRLALGQQYQFFRNAWAHPHLAAGVDLTWERTTERVAAITTYDSQGRPRELFPARTIGPDTRLRVRPYGEVGFKAYMTQRAFFRNDLRFAFRKGIDEVSLRFGFGVDF